MRFRLKTVPRVAHSRRGISTIVASLLMVVIVIIMSVTVFVYSTGLLGSLLISDDESPFGEDFRIMFASYQFRQVSRTLGPGPSLGSYNYNCTSSINSPFNGNVLVPSGATCTITANINGNVGVAQGATLILQGASIAGNLIADRAYKISLESTTVTVTGNVELYGVETVIITGSTTDVPGNLIVRGSKTVTISSNLIRGNVELVGNDSVVLTSNTIQGNLLFDQNLLCAGMNNVVAGNTTGECPDKIFIHLRNTGSKQVKIKYIYVDSQPWAGVSWKLVSGAPANCAGQIVSGYCNSLPMVIPKGEMSEVLIAWAPINISKEMRLLMFSSTGNYVEARIHPQLGLQCGPSLGMSPRSPSHC